MKATLAHGSARGATPRAPHDDLPSGRSAWVAVVVATVIAHWPALRLGWWRDDYTWLFDRVDLGRLFVDVANPQLAGRYRPLQKLLSLAVGSLGMDARLPSRLVCVVLLAIAGVLTAELTRQLTRSRLAAALAGILLVTNGRVAIVATWVSWWSSQLCLVFTLAALLLGLRFCRGPRLASGLATVAASGLALASFEVGVQVPVALAVLFAFHARRRPSEWWPMAGSAVVVACFAIAYARDPDRVFGMVGSGALWARLVGAADHEATALAAAAIASLVLAIRGRPAGEWSLLVVLAAISLVPGITHPSPDSYHFLLLYAASAALVGAAIADAVALVPGARRFESWSVVLLVAGVAGALGNLGLQGLIAREWEMRDSRKLLAALAADDCLRHRPATIFPLGADARDRAIAFMMPPSGIVPLAGLCGAPVRLAADRPPSSPADCGDEGYLLTRDGDLIDCAPLAESPELLAAAVACGVPLDSPALLRPSGVWSGPRIACVNVPRGEGIVESDPPVVLEGDQAVLRKTGSISFAVPEDARRFTARLDRLRAFGANADRASERPALGVVSVYADSRLVTQAEVGPDADQLGIEAPVGAAAVVTLWYQARTNEGPEMVLFRPRFVRD